MLYFTILYYTILYYTILYYTIYYTILYYTIPYYTLPGNVILNLVAPLQPEPRGRAPGDDGAEGAGLRGSEFGTGCLSFFRGLRRGLGFIGLGFIWGSGRYRLMFLYLLGFACAYRFFTRSVPCRVLLHMVMKYVVALPAASLQWAV